MTDEMSLIDGLAQKQAAMAADIKELIAFGGAQIPDLELLDMRQTELLADIETLRQQQLTALGKAMNND